MIALASRIGELLCNNDGIYPNGSIAKYSGNLRSFSISRTLESVSTFPSKIKEKTALEGYESG